MRKVRDHGSEAFRLGYDVAGQRRMKTRADQAKTGFRRLTKMQANVPVRTSAEFFPTE